MTRPTITSLASRSLERLHTADLPPGVEPQIAPLSTAIGEIFVPLRGDGHRTDDLRTLEDWVVERQLRMVPGVADIVRLWRPDQDLRG